MDSLHEVANKVVASLTEEELRSSAVYLDPAPLERGAPFSIRGKSLTVSAPSILAFVDLQPQANWGHPCRYLFVSLDDGSIISIDAQFPPRRESLRIIHRAEAVQDWMLLSSRQLYDE
jgi:hypothetical protein